MTFARDKRLLLGWLALLVPLPLPLNDVLEWPVLFVYAFFVIHFLRRVERGQQRWLPNWALNLLGLVYLPILFFDMQLAVARNQTVKSLLHLILFVLLAKLFSIRREKDKWHIFISLFFLFVAAMATSSHLTIAFYLVAALGAGFYVMTRFAHLNLAARLGRAAPGETPRAGTTAPRLPSLRWPMAVSLLLVVLLTVPIFAMLPRLRQPLVMGQGGGNIGLSRTTGFSDQVDLSLTSEIRSNTSIALRLEFEDPAVNAENFRFKAATYDFYRDNNWHRHPLESREIFAGADGLMRLPGAPTGEIRGTVYLEPLRSRSMVLPSRTVAVDPLRQTRTLRLDVGGAVLIPGLPARQTVSYDVILAEEPYITAMLEGSEQMQVDALDTGGLTPRMAELATQVMGEGTASEKTDRLLRHLLNEYAYTLDFVGRDGQDPLDDFLFVYKSGHCEYFASTMVLMLRSEGIPARLVTGFLGAEANAIEDYFVVRQANAHAWVEAYTPERGWQVYDPTPPDGRPSAAVRDWRLFLQQLYDYVAFRWDRYVLTYGADDQSDFFADMKRRAVELWERWKEIFGDDEEEASGSLPGDTAALPGGGLEADDTAEEALWQRPMMRLLGLLVFLALVAGGVLVLRGRPLTPEEAYDRLRRGLSGHGLDVSASTPPFALRRLLRREHPEAAVRAEPVIALYVRASFAERAAELDERRPLRAAVAEALAAVGRDQKQRRRATRPGEDRRAA